MRNRGDRPAVTRWYERHEAGRCHWLAPAWVHTQQRCPGDPWRPLTVGRGGGFHATETGHRGQSGLSALGARVSRQALTGPTTFSSRVFPSLLGLCNTWHGRTVATLSAGRVQLHRVRGRKKVQGRRCSLVTHGHLLGVGLGPWTQPGTGVGPPGQAGGRPSGFHQMYSFLWGQQVQQILLHLAGQPHPSPWRSWDHALETESRGPGTPAL